MVDKIKKTQKENLEGISGRDLFQTPNYATELLIPFIPKDIRIIWECANGNGKISDILSKHNYSIIKSDLSTGFNFLTDKLYENWSFQAIITNPPFSLKRKFYQKCVDYNVPFALLIPWDMTGWLWEAYQNDGCQAIVPNRRINYITPTGKSEATGQVANFHSFWLTRGFNLEKNFTFVELPIEARKNI